MRECETAITGKCDIHKKKICIFAVGHKAFQLPVNDAMYIKLMVGKPHDDLQSEYLVDCVRDNIADRNPRYNELTGLYWIWKNSHSEVVGLCHYRRYFTTCYGKINNLLFGVCNIFLQEKEIINILKSYDVILHNKTFTLRGNQNQLCVRDKVDEKSKKSKIRREILELVDETFAKIYPEDLRIYKKVMKRKYAHLLNVMICKKELLDKYCEWLFPLLFSIEKEIDRQFPSEEHARCMGLLGERFLDMWVEKEDLRVKECFTVNTEKKDWKIW